MDVWEVVQTIRDNDGSLDFWSPSRTTSGTDPNVGNQNIVLVNTVPDPIRHRATPRTAIEPHVLPPCAISERRPARAALATPS